LLSPISYKRCYAEFYIAINPIGGAPLQRAVVLKWFYSLSHRKTFVGGTCALPSAFVVTCPIKLLDVLCILISVLAVEVKVKVEVWTLAIASLT